MGRDPERRRAWYRKRYANTIRQQRKEYRKKYIAQGLCANCGARPKIGKGLKCEVCTETQRKRCVKYYDQLRRDAYNAYGGPRCACCDASEILFLSIDHI